MDLLECTHIKNENQWTLLIETHVNVVHVLMNLESEAHTYTNPEVNVQEINSPVSFHTEYFSVSGFDPNC